MTWARRPLQGLLLAVAVLLVLFGGPLAHAWGSPGSLSAGFASPVGTATTKLGAIAGDVASGPVEGGLPDIGPLEPDGPEAERGVEAVAPSGQLSAPRAPGFGALSRADDFGVWPYGTLRGDLSGTGLQAHHLFERRFATVLGQDVGDMASIAVTQAEHTAFTNAWRQAIPYGAGTANATPQQIMNTARQIYADYPDILRALGLG